MMAEAEAWPMVRRNHDGNLNVIRMPDGARPAWELTEVEADDVIAYVQRDHRKVHGQSYWRPTYRRGRLGAFRKANNIRI